MYECTNVQIYKCRRGLQYHLYKFSFQGVWVLMSFVISHELMEFSVGSAMTFSFEASAARSQMLFHVHPKEQELHKRSLICHQKWLHGVRNVQEHREEADFHQDQSFVASSCIRGSV